MVEKGVIYMNRRSRLYYTCYAYLSVTAPNDAEETCFAYFASTPRVYRSGGSTQRERLSANSASDTSTVINCVSLSIVMISPSCSNPIGPPSCASGEI